MIEAIDALSFEIKPYYLNHSDYLLAKGSFAKGVCEDFEDLMILHSALRLGCEIFLTNDRELLALEKFENIKLISPTQNIERLE